MLETGLTQNSVYILSSLLAHLIRVMDVNQLDRGDVVAQEAGYGLDIYTLSEETGGVGVPKVVYGVAGDVPVNLYSYIKETLIQSQSQILQDFLYMASS